MPSNIILQQSFTMVSCTCGLAFAVPDRFDSARREDGMTFYCPRGCRLSFSVTVADKLRKELEDKQRLLDQAHNREAAVCQQLKKAQAEKKRLAKRLEAGVCPVAGCKRHFTNLQRHIETEHKGVAIEEAAEVKKIESGVVQ